MATYVNDLRLKEIATGDESGTWGTSTNTNLELIGEAMGVGAEAVANASTHTITMADGAADQFRSTFLRLTGGGQACTVTLAPNTLSHTWIMRNETAAALTFTQGSGANVAIAAGQTKIVATDGLGSGAVVYEMDDLELAGNLVAASLDISGDIDVDGTTNLDIVDIDGAVNMATTALVTGVLTTTAATVFNGGFASNADSTMGTDKKIIFRDSAIHISSTADGDLSIAADDEIDLTSTLIDVNGNLDVSGTTVSAGKITADAGIDIDNINIDGTTIALSSGDLTLDVAGDILLDADSDGSVRFLDGGTEFAHHFLTSNNYVLQAPISNGDIIIRGNDGGNSVDALTLDMSAAGRATFNNNVVVTDGNSLIAGSGDDLQIFYNGTNGEIDVSSGNLKIDVAGDLILEAKVGINNPNPAQILSICNAANPNRNGMEFAIGANDTASNTIQNFNRATSAYTPMTIDASLLTFRVGTSAAERIRINATGDTFFGITSKTDAPSNGAVYIAGDNSVGSTNSYAQLFVVHNSSNNHGIILKELGSSGQALQTLNSSGTIVGGIATNNTVTAFNTSSDRRLKENIADADDAGSRVDAIQVRKFDWKADGSHQDYGMVAQELQTVAPEAVSGNADSEDIMGVDYSKLVPMMLKEIQSLRARIAKLEA